MPRLRAFTLIELLVVVTIIVVLLALLAPALDRSVYQAQLAVCGSNLRGTAGGAQSYAAGNKRYYPHRPSKPNIAYNRPDLISVGSGADDRPYLQGYIPLGLLVDPLVVKIDLSLEAAPPNLTGYQVHAPIALWFGMRFSGPRGGTGIFKLGDRLEWDGNGFALLASDLDTIFPAIGAFASHPDHDALLTQEFAQNQPNGATEYRMTLSRWSNRNIQVLRGPMDTNYAFEDGSTHRYTGVRWNDQRVGGMTVEAPVSNQDFADNPSNYQHLPRH